MGNNRLLLGSVAFSISFGLSLLINRDFKPALLTGLIAVPASLAGIFVVNGQQRIQQQPTVSALKAQIYQLEKWEAELNQSILAITTEKQRLEVNINFLNIELNQLYAQIAEQRSYKQQLSQDVATLTENQQQLETKLHDLQTQVENCEQRREELYQSLRSLRTEKQNESVSFNSMQAELQQLQVQVTNLQQQKLELTKDVAVFQQLKPQLEAQSQKLQDEIQQLESQSIKLDSTCRAINQEKKATEDHINLLKTELSQLQTHISEQHSKKEKLEQELYRLKTDIQKLKNEQKQPEKLPEEWTQFVTHLSEPELQVLQAIVQQSDPSIEIKRIAEANITMPELLIDSINECALDTIGDLIIEPGTETIPLAITEEYVTNLNKAIAITRKN